MPGNLGQSITVFNKSGRVVSSSRHVLQVFKEAKAAYRDRKAEIIASRHGGVKDDRRAAHALSQLSLEEHDRQSATGARERRPKSERGARRPPNERRRTSQSTTHSERRRSRPSSDYHAAAPASPRSPIRSHTSPNVHHVDHALAYGGLPPGQAMVRRYSDDAQLSAVRRRSSSVDEDLAYGEMPPPLPVRRMDDETELRGKVTKLQQLLDEANCLQHSATKTIEHLQKNPESLAAVGLALAEISKLARRMSPGALMALKRGFPAIFALLASPQFLIATGVGVGVVVVMLGGYKIIKRTKAKKQLAAEGQLQEIEPELDHIERWRRGIADVEVASVGTSVDGEFITPAASRIRLEEGTLRPENLRKSKSERRRKTDDGRPSAPRSMSSRSDAGSRRHGSRA